MDVPSDQSPVGVPLPPTPPPGPPSAHEAGLPADQQSRSAGLPPTLRRLEGRRATKQARVYAGMATYLRDGEQLLVLDQASRMRKPAVSWLAVTDRRLLLLDPQPERASWAVTFSAPVAQVQPASDSRGYGLNLTVDGQTIKVSLTRSDGLALAEEIGAVATAAQRRDGGEVDRDDFAPDRSHIASWTPAQAAAWVNALDGTWGKVNKSSAHVIAQHAADEDPWLVIVGTGVLASFDDRLIIVKAGGLDGWLAGALGGYRSTTFDFLDITGIEYNAGMSTGVLEILTASYQGTANKDFWKGSSASRNTDANDPFTLSNTLPLLKGVYEHLTPQIVELRRRIAQAKRPSSAPTAVAPSALPLAAQLRELGDLYGAGVLSDEEFTVAKATLLAGRS